MKKSTLTLLFFAITLACFAKTNIESKGVSYIIDEISKTAEVAENKTKQYKGTVTIPNEIEYYGVKYKVLRIADYAFYNSPELKEVIIKEGVKVIGNGAFSNCTELRHIDLPEGIEQICVMAFNGCRKLNEITCRATVLPLVEDNCFAHFNAIIYVPSKWLKVYEKHSTFGRFVVEKIED